MLKVKRGEATKGSLSNQLRAATQVKQTCAICLRTIRKNSVTWFVTNCDHYYHWGCWQKYCKHDYIKLEAKSCRVPCPVCRCPQLAVDAMKVEAAPVAAETRVEAESAAEHVPWRTQVFALSDTSSVRSYDSTEEGGQELQRRRREVEVATLELQLQESRIELENKRIELEEKRTLLKERQVALEYESMVLKERQELGLEKFLYLRSKLLNQDAYARPLVFHK